MFEQQADETSEIVPVPDRMSTRYGFGGTPPLPLRQAWEVNLAQFECARVALDAHVALLVEAVGAMPTCAETSPC